MPMFDFLGGFLLGARARSEKIQQEHAECMELAENENWERRKNKAIANLELIKTAPVRVGVTEFSRERRIEQLRGVVLTNYIRRSDVLMRLAEEEIQRLTIHGY